MRRDARDRMALSLVVEPGEPRLRALLTDLEPGAVLDALRRGPSLSRGGVPAAWRERVRDIDKRADAALARAAQAGLRWIAPGDVGWPTSLDELDLADDRGGVAGAPLGLWVRGRGDLARVAARSVAVVGARDCTTYGAEVASELAADVADAGFTVVSGAAFGIDACAHRGALALGRPTVAVLAGGADVDYPRAHAALLSRIADDGLVISEQPPGQLPLKSQFLSRNRLIAALSLGTVVIEAAARSGSLNTLHWADQLGRSTMGVPGPVTSAMSMGVHEAVRGGEAVLVTSGQQVVEELSGLGADEAVGPERPATAFDALPHGAQRVIDALSWNESRMIEQLASTARLSRGEVRRALALLVRRGFAARTEGGWSLVRRADLG